MSIIQIPMKVRPRVHYRLTARKRAKSGRILYERSSAELPNVFTNAGVEQLFGRDVSGGGQSINTSVIAVAVGTGNTAPTVSDVALDTFLAGAYRSTFVVSRSFVDGESSTGYIQIQKDTLFATGVAEGTIAEVAAYFQQIPPNADAIPMSRALVVDGEGAPTTFTVLSTEQLLLTALFRLNIDYSDTVLEDVEVEGEDDQTITVRPILLGNLSTGWAWPRPFGSSGTSWIRWGETYTLPSATGSGLGSSSGAGAGQANTAQGTRQGSDAYVNDSQERVAWLRQPTGSERNIVGVEFVRAHGSYAVKLDPGVTKSDLHQFTLAIKYSIDNTP